MECDRGEPSELADFDFRRGAPCPACGELYDFDLIELWPGDNRSVAFMVAPACGCEPADEKLRGDLELALELDPVERIRFLKPLRRRYGAWNGADLVAVGMIGRPVARRLDPNDVVEVNRVCTRGDIPRELVTNACSMIYAEAAREAERRGFRQIITYTLENEDAAALRSLGWVAARTGGGSWDRPSRRRSDTAPTCPKVRWTKVLHPRSAHRLSAAA